ncbi:MAG TPA: glycosyltransferase [Azospirillaceae bacterium]|nr:glycosyltransferase [Azospirillaceae bacterium]
MTPRDDEKEAEAPAATGPQVRWHLLQRVLVDRPAHLEPLYWRPAANDPAAGTVPAVRDGALELPGGAGVRFDTYFGALFEFQWRLYTAVEDLALELDVAGEVEISLCRRTRESGTRVLARLRSRGDGRPLRVPVPDRPAHFRGAGILFAEVSALAPGARITGGRWLAAAARLPGAVGLGLVFCTFNRERELGRVLSLLAADPEARAAVAAVAVVNQGRPGLETHPGFAAAASALGGLVRVVEQGNFGGAGGFTRGLMEVLERPGVTHAVLMDDDVEAETEAFVRTAAFYRFARPGLALGGHMLDGLKPLRLYEAGARVNGASWYLEPIHLDLDVSEPACLDRFLDVVGMHYNGWWYFAVPAEVARREGLPMPCFIRGDDVEYGLRLHGRGVHTVGLPGVAIWHEPFYVKIGGWQLYYETRNMLVTAAVHFRPSRRHLASVMLKRLLTHLLTFRYYNAALVVRAIEDFLEGPGLFDRPPQPIHEGLAAIRARYPQETVPREAVLGGLATRPPPRTRPGFALALAAAVLSNWCRPTRPGAPPGWIAVRNLVWFRMGHAEHVAADTYWDRDIPAFRRSREDFRELLGAGVRVLRRLWRAWPGLGDRWREAHPRFTTPEHWRRYLGLDGGLDAGPGEPAPPSDVGCTNPMEAADGSAR